MKKYSIAICFSLFLVAALSYVCGLTLTDLTAIPNEAGPKQIKDSVNANVVTENANIVLIEAADAAQTAAITNMSPARLTVRSAYIIVGNLTSNGAAVAVSGDATISTNGAVTVTNLPVYKVALADGTIPIGDSGGDAQAKSITGDISMTREGIVSVVGTNAGAGVLYVLALDSTTNALYITNGVIKAMTSGYNP